MKIASIADVKARLSAYLKESESGPVIITRNGKAVAVMLAGTDDDELERLILAYSPKFLGACSISRTARSRTREVFRTSSSGVGNRSLLRQRLAMRIPGQRIRRTRLIQTEKYVVAVEVEMVVPVDDPSEPCYESETVQLLREIKEHAERGDVAWPTTKGQGLRCRGSCVRGGSRGSN